MNNTNGLDRQRAELAASLARSTSVPATQPARIATNGTGNPLNGARPLPPAISDFDRVAALGFANLIPVIPPNGNVSPRSHLHARVGRPGMKDPRGKAPGVLTSDGWTFLKGWTEQPPATADDRRRWSAMNASVGLRLGDGLLGIDVDTVDAELASRARAILKKIIPGAHVERVGQAPKFLVLLRVPPGLPYKVVEFGLGPDGKSERIEALSKGKQAVVAGEHPATGRPYTWHPAMPRITEIAEASAAQIDAFFARVAAEFPQATSVRTEGSARIANQEALRCDPEVIEAAVAALPNTTARFPSRESYRDMAYAIKAAIADDARAFACFAGWSDRWEDPPDGIGNVEGYAESMWRSLKPPFRIGARWLLEKAEAITGKPFAAERWFSTASPAASIWDAVPATAAEPPAPRSLTVRRIKGDETQRKIPVREWLIHPWCPAGNVSIVIGAPAVSKSTFLLMVALAVASGEENVLRGADRLSDERLHKHGKVVVYNAEDTLDEMERRLTGVRRFHGIDRFMHDIIAISGVDDGARATDDDKLIIAERKENNGPILRGAGSQRLETLIRDEQPVLVILDPLISLSRGLVENSNEDMDRLLAILRAIARIGNTTLLVAHHTAKSADRSGGDLNATRGASAIGAAVRGGISLTKHLVTPDTKQDGELRGLAPGWYVLAKDIKAQYGAENEPVAYRLKSTPVGNGAGDPLPDSAQLLFDDDPAEFLRQSGDYVAVHEIVDRRESDAVARAAASRRNVSEALRIAEIVLDQLGDRAAAPFNSEYLVIAEQLQRNRIMRGESRQRVTDKLSSVLGRGVIVARAGKSTRVSMAKENESRTAPWILRVEGVEAKEDAGGLSSLSN